MEAAAVTIAVNAAKTVLERLLGMAENAVAKERALLRGVEGDVRFIRDELEMMRSFLILSSSTAACPYAAAGGWRDCCGNCCRSKVRNTWARLLRGLAYDIEDCLLDSDLVLKGRNLADRHRPTASPSGSWASGTGSRRTRSAARRTESSSTAPTGPHPLSSSTCSMMTTTLARCSPANIIRTPTTKMTTVMIGGKSLSAGTTTRKP